MSLVLAAGLAAANRPTSGFFSTASMLRRVPSTAALAAAIAEQSLAAMMRSCAMLFYAVLCYDVPC